MRLHRLVLTGVGPFVGRQEIDFDAVSRSGLFLIEGPTGSGKTTIIDAIVFALYGTVSGEDSDVGRMRSQLCTPGQPTEITLDFSVGNARYTITRCPAYERARVRGTGTMLERARQTLVKDGDTAHGLTNARDIGVEVLRALGLTADQFRRLVVLPQGEFDSLLRASPRDRYQQLATLIDDGYLARVQEDLKIQADAAAQRRARADAAVADVLTVLAARASEVLTAEDDAPFDPDAAAARISAMAREQQALVAGLTEPLDQARTRAITSAHRADTVRAADRARTALLAAQAGLHPLDAGLDEAGLRARRADIIARRARLEPLAAWEKQAIAREHERALLVREAVGAQEVVRQAQVRQETLPARREDLDARLATALREADRLQDRQAEVQRLQEVEQLLRQRNEAEEAHARAVQARDAAAAALQKERDDLQGSRDAAHSLLRRQLDQRAAHLASLLEAGQPCQVCGSSTHPHPATFADDGPIVRDTDVAQAEEEVRAAERRVTAASTAHAEAEQEESLRRQAVTAVHTRLESLGAQDLPERQVAAASALAASRAAQESLPDLEAEKKDLDREQQQAADAIPALASAAATAEAAVASFDAGVARQLELIAEEVQGEESAEAALLALDRREKAIDAVESARRESAGLPVDADLAAVEQAEAEDRRAAQEAEERFTQAEARATTLANAAAAMADLLAQCSEARGEAERVRRDTEKEIWIGQLVTARSAANTKRLTLEAYAVQRRFDSVLEAASVHLERMSSGKYSFELREEATGHAHAGLGISVRDSWSGQRRDPATLSGGECFYASLSLALGLADVVREETGGVELETLFVDEGFGALDQDTLTVVLDQLDALRSRGRTVGVVSHVTEMKQWVHDRIEVVPGARPGEGSRIRVS